MKINEVIINEGVWDSVKNAASGVKGIAGNAINKVNASGLTTGLKKVGNAALTPFKYLNDIPDKKATANQIAVKNQFIKNFNQDLKKQIASNKVADVPFDLTTFINQLAKKDGLDLTHSAYGSKFAPAINAAQNSNYSPASVNALGSLMYSAAVAAQSGITTAPNTQPTQPTQPRQPRQPFKPGGNVSRIR
jgi:hypothetical protein